MYHDITRSIEDCRLAQVIHSGISRAVEKGRPDNSCAKEGHNSRLGLPQKSHVDWHHIVAMLMHMLRNISSRKAGDYLRTCCAETVHQEAT